MILATSDSVPGKRITEVKGLVQGNTIRARNIGRDIVAGLRNIVGGEVTEYTRLMSESREQAIVRMVEQAESMGANAVVGMRFVTSMVMQGASELLAYGTAVVVEDEA
ncbi:MAG: YbjQ family protein [Chloroflexota bacterium]|nr:YbjQ family protein [Chloroflexota bacterium]MDE2884169.1 YbjQ family protein [Chloroflexota bacterium]